MPDYVQPTLPLMWQVEGDSYNLADTVWCLLSCLSPEDLIWAGAGGSTFTDQRHRILQRPELRANPLWWWDGSPNGHIVGSIRLECQMLADVFAFKAPYRNILVVSPVVVYTLADAAQTVADMHAFRDYVCAVYGPQHFFDPVPALHAEYHRRVTADPSYATTADDADVAAGFMPRKITSDGLHPDAAAKAAVVAAAKIPMERARFAMQSGS